MSEYIVKIGFWLRAYDGFTVEAESDADAIEQAKAAARMCSISRPARPSPGPTRTAGWPGRSHHLTESEAGDEHP